MVPRSLIRRTSSQTVEPARRVEAGGRLVEEEHLGLVHERRREVEPALHAAGVALDPAVGRVVELDELEQLLGARRPRRAPADAEQPGLQHEQLAAGLARVEPGLLERDADPAPRLVRVGRDVDAGDAGGTRR